MDADIWNKSKRGFPFNVPMWVIVAVCLGVPLLASFYVLDYSNAYLLRVYAFTLFLSSIAYFITVQAIEQFKESLDKNGLYGIDLNKAGVRENKPHV